MSGIKSRQIAHESLKAEELEVGSDRSFGIVIGLALSLLAIVLPWKWDFAIPWWLWGMALVFLLLAWIRPALLHPLNILWMRFAHLLHLIISPLVLGLIFYLVVFPTSLFVRISGKDPLRLKPRQPGETHWIDREKSYTDLKKQY